MPDSPSPAFTQPTTRYETKRALPDNAAAGDAADIKPAHNHLPLVVMLVLTQLSVGAFAYDYAANFAGQPNGVHRMTTLVALALGLAGLGASVLHLGRPLYAFRAVLGVLHSWMSREVVCFGLFGALAPAYVATVWAEPLCAFIGLPSLQPSLRASLELGLGAATIGSGALGVLCSVLLYAVTGRRWWRLSATGAKFVGTTLGPAAVLVACAASLPAVHLGRPPSLMSWGLLIGGSLICVLKLAGERRVLGHVADSRWSEFKRTAVLLSGTLEPLLRLRFGFGLLGIVMPWLWVSLAAMPLASSGALLGHGAQSLLAYGALSLAGLALAAGEILERSLFFMAVSPDRMPGAVGR